jgi:hypothetical protein
MSKWVTAVKELDDFLKTHTILETLKHAPAQVLEARRRPR